METFENMCVCGGEFAWIPDPHILLEQLPWLFTEATQLSAFSKYLYLSARGLRGCSRAFSGCGWARAALCLWCSGSHCGGFPCCGAQVLGVGFSSCPSRALESRLSSHTGLVALQMWDVPRPGIEPKSPTLLGGFLSPAPQVSLLTMF